MASIVCGYAAEACPLCGGDLIRVGDVVDDRSKPSRNLCVWNRSICGNYFYEDDSKICKQCWHSYNEKMKRWEMSSEQVDAFRQPLTTDITNVPLPTAKDITSLVVYSQKISDGNVKESVGFWCNNNDDYRVRLTKYTSDHALSITNYEADSQKNQSHITIEKTFAKTPADHRK